MMKTKRFVGVVVPEQETRAARKVRVKQMRDLIGPANTMDKPEKYASEAKSKQWGRRGHTAWWGPAHVRPRPHRASALVTSYAYPFLTEEGLGTRGVWMGKLADVSGGGD